MERIKILTMCREFKSMDKPPKRAIRLEVQFLSNGEKFCNTFEVDFNNFNSDIIWEIENER